MNDYINLTVCRVSCLALIIVMILSLLFYCEYSKMDIVDEPSSLKLLHIIIRSGEPEALYLNKFQEIPYQSGRLSLNGKKTLYALGGELKHYYRNFIGGSYEPQHLEATVLQGNVAEESLQIILAALYPPKGTTKWMGGLNWQPIPYTITNNSDLLLNFVPNLCPKWQVHYNEALKGKKLVNITEEDKKYFKMIKKHTGWEESFISAYKLNYNMDLGLVLPEWANEIYPETTKILSKSFLDLASSTEEMKRITSGSLLWKILWDTNENLAGTSEIKIHLYSVEDYTLFFLARTLDLELSKMSRQGTNLAVEVHEIDTNYFIQFIYMEEVGGKRKILEIPNCGKLCPFQFFYDKNKKFEPKMDMCKKRI